MPRIGAPKLYLLKWVTSIFSFSMRFLSKSLTTVSQLKLIFILYFFILYLSTSFTLSCCICFSITPCHLMSHSVSALWHGGSSDSKNFTLFSLLLRLCVGWTDGLAVLDPTSPPSALSTPAIRTLVPCTRGAINPEPTLLPLLLNTVILLAQRAWTPGGFFLGHFYVGHWKREVT